MLHEIMRNVISGEMMHAPTTSITIMASSHGKCCHRRSFRPSSPHCAHQDLLNKHGARPDAVRHRKQLNRYAYWDDSRRAFSLMPWHFVRESARSRSFGRLSDTAYRRAVGSLFACAMIIEIASGSSSHRALFHWDAPRPLRPSCREPCHQCVLVLFI